MLLYTMQHARLSYLSTLLTVLALLLLFTSVAHAIPTCPPLDIERGDVANNPLTITGSREYRDVEAKRNTIAPLVASQSHMKDITGGQDEKVLPSRSLFNPADTFGALKLSWDSFNVFLPQSDASITLTEMYNSLDRLMTNFDGQGYPLGAPQRFLVFIYGVFRLSIYCAEQAIPWEDLKPVMQRFAEMTRLGLVGLYEVSIVIGTGLTMNLVLSVFGVHFEWPVHDRVRVNAIG